MALKETHYLGSTTYSVTKCKECEQNVVKTTNQFFVGDNKERRLKLEEKFKARGLVKLPDFPADEICDCAANADEDEDEEEE